MPEIAKAASRARADVVLLTDHDSLEAKRRGEEGWYGDVLLLAGVEVSPRDATTTSPSASTRRSTTRASTAPGSSRPCAAPAALGFAAHPFSSGSERFKRAGEGMPFDGLTPTRSTASSCGAS